jgi:CheY-like chemotaxis protein
MHADSSPRQVILAVDDEPLDLALIERALVRGGYAVQTALSCEDALLILQKLVPKVLILDVAMPGMSGYELCTRLKNDNQLKDIPVVFLSARDSPKDLKTWREVGGAFYVPKAKGFRNLLSAVRVLCVAQERRTRTKESGGAGARFPERRVELRYALSAAADLVEPIHGTHVSGRTCNISLTGCEIDTSNLLPQASVIQLRIVGDRQKFETRARIIYRRHGRTMGVAFCETAPDQKEIVTRWISELEAAQKPGQSSIVS